MFHFGDHSKPTLLDDPPSSPTNTAADRLRTEMLAMRLSFTWFGTRKTLSPEQKVQAAESFGAEGDYLSAGKKLLNTKHAKFKAVTAVKTQAVGYFKAMSLPFPEPGLRLIKQDDLASVNDHMTSLQSVVGQAPLCLTFEAASELLSPCVRLVRPDSTRALFPNIMPISHIRRSTVTPSSGTGCLTYVTKTESVSMDDLQAAAKFLHQIGDADRAIAAIRQVKSLQIN